MLKKTFAEVRTSGLAVGALLLCLHGTPVVAEYTDPIDLPALKMPLVKQSLILDVIKTGEKLIATGERGHILHSDDQGKTWSQADVATRAQLNAAYFLDPNNGWAVGEDQVILNTTDGGKSWQLKQDGRNADQQGPLLDVVFTNEREGFAIGVFNKLFYTANGGQSWEQWQAHIENEDEWHLFSISSVGKNRIYISSEMGLIFRSLDSGQSFQPVQTDHDGSFQGVLAREGADGKDQLVLFGVGGVIYTTTDGGERWNYVETGVKTGLAAGSWLDDGSALIVGADGMVIKLDDQLQQTSLHPIANGLPLNAISVSGDLVTLVGLGGIQSYTLEQLLGRR